jgi:nitrite reductase/ring-hydroxylating ferredoxin subunit
VSLGGSEFELDGKLAEGPAQRPIVAYKSRVEAGELVVDL